MTYEELYRLCKQQQRIWGADDAKLVLQLTEPVRRNRKTTRLGHRKGPVGTLDHTTRPPRALFRVPDLLAHIQTTEPELYARLEQEVTP